MKRFLQRTKIKLLSAYYGQQNKSLKVICITGTTGKETTAHLIYEILSVAKKRTAILASDKDVKAITLHRFLSDTWKSGAEYAIVTASAQDLHNQVFYKLPLHLVAITDCIPSSLTDLDPNAVLRARTSLFDQQPNLAVFNSDDAYYNDFAKYSGSERTLTYGHKPAADVRIAHSKLYKKGIEASLSYHNQSFNVASFLTGEPSISYMTCAVTIALALDFSTQDIIEGIANYEPEDSSESKSTQ